VSRSTVPLILRLLLGALFVVASTMKMRSPQDFALSVKAFKIFPEAGDHLVMLTTFWVPWLELTAGVLVLLGLWTRAAAVVLGALLIVFLVGIVSVLARGLDVDCGCFGKLDAICTGSLGACHIVRNAVLLGIAAFLVIRGGGGWSLDRVLDRKPAVA